jgi:hypothetical protein
VIVVDASAITEFLLQTPLGSRVEARLFRGRLEFHAPHLLDVEVVQALRRLVRATCTPAEPKRPSMRIPVIVNADSGVHERRFRSSRALSGAKRRLAAGVC